MCERRIAQLFKVPLASARIQLRRVEARREGYDSVAFHLDHSRVVMQVPLNSDTE